MARKIYPEEFKRQVVSLHQAGQSIASLSREFEVTPPTLRTWVDRFGKEAESASDEAQRRMSRELADLKEENAILKKAAAWFARETLKTPRRSSHS